VYKNKWPKDWTQWWFYHMVDQQEFLVSRCEEVKGNRAPDVQLKASQWPTLEAFARSLSFLLRTIMSFLGWPFRIISCLGWPLLSVPWLATLNYNELFGLAVSDNQLFGLAVSDNQLFGLSLAISSNVRPFFYCPTACNLPPEKIKIKSSSHLSILVVSVYKHI
jgi:hypothetical protein